jgi:gamma-glutamyl-gamma-aminobutyrate hydrolase PuuD
MKIKSVFVVGGCSLTEDMYLQEGVKVVEDIEDADIVQFTGGEDVSPVLYGETLHPGAYVNSDRDKRDYDAFLEARALEKKIVGICRGGQFLNVVCGGKMYQDVDGHATGEQHIMYDELSGTQFPVTSTHHQMMIPGKGAQVLAYASEATYYESMKDENIVRYVPKRGMDVEVVWYPGHNALCFQPHPEYVDRAHPCRKYFFDLVGSW